MRTIEVDIVDSTSIITSYSDSNTYTLIIKSRNFGIKNPLCTTLTFDPDNVIVYFYGQYNNAVAYNHATQEKYFQTNTGVVAGNSLTYLDPGSSKPKLDYLYIPNKRYIDQYHMWQANQRAPLEFELICPVAISSTTYSGGNPHVLIAHLPSNINTGSFTTNQIGDTN